MRKTKVVLKDTHLADKTAKTPQGSDYCNSQAGGYLWGEAVVPGMGHVHGGSLVASKVLFLDLVVGTRLFPWNNSSTHTFVLCGFLYLCSLKKIFFLILAFLVGLFCFKDSIIVREEQVNVLHSI